ncbi:MAG: type III-A CRISPR-associated protein Cas10/Csm1 [Actinomycetes bacterium]|nr:type III-A CRISPR-associated protein Cas10/Csm1 [Actinomycetes bacterium]
MTETNGTNDTNLMTETQVTLTFGALLHDIGKIVQRAGAGTGRATHSRQGADFLADLQGRNPGISDAIIDQVRYHHAREMKAATAATLPADSLAWITYFADNISAGMDRKYTDDDNEAPDWDPNVKLHKIFNIIDGHTDENTIEIGDIDGKPGSYNAIRERIATHLESIEVSPRGVNSLINLLEATTDTVPSSTNKAQLVDVSLFDHAKTTAAIAACIHAYLDATDQTDYRATLFDQDTSPAYYDTDMFLLYSLDMSGIQSFIYNISGDGALKQLRARSLYLEMMLEHIADELLARLQLSRANLLYTGGGHAYLLLPNTARVIETLSSFRREVSDWFLSHFRTDLYLAAARVTCSSNDLANSGDDKNRYRNLYRELTRQLADAKASRYTADTIRKLNFKQAGEQDSRDHSRECTECHRSDLHISDRKCSLCNALGEISADLARKDIFVVSRADADTDGRGYVLPLPFDCVFSVYSENEYRKNTPANLLRVYTKNSPSTGLDLATHIWMGDYAAPVRDGIGDYARGGETLPDGLGIKRLGVLRADVDNLGWVFTHGLPPDKASISRSSTLSRALSRFFKYELNRVLAAGGYRAQIIYSGGDDLFLIGNWSDVLYAARDIRDALDDFTGNGVLTLSAGIGMYTATFPIARMAAEVGCLESVAKRRDGKDALALWSADTVYGWGEFESEVWPKLHEVQRVFEDNEKGKAFIYRMIALLRNSQDSISIPRLAYLLARSFEGKQNGTEVSRQFYGWAIDTAQRRYLITALEWYVYSIREKG